MASATDLSGRLISYTIGSGPTTFEIIQGSVTDTADVSGYLPTGTSTIKRHVGHGREVVYSFTGVLLTANLPFSAHTPGTNVTSVTVTLDSTAGSPKTHTSTDAVIRSSKHEFDTTTHQVFSVELVADGNYTLPS